MNRRAIVIAMVAAVVISIVASSIACSHREHGPVTVPATRTVGETRIISFEDATPGQPPPGFRCASPGPADAKPARWQVVEAGDAPEGKRVLEQSDGDNANHRYPVALLEGSPFKDVRVAVQAEAVSGARDRSFGVVVRARDERNYYVARANTSEWGENVRFYKFVDGKRSELDEWEGSVKVGIWHRLQIDALGSTFTVLLDGKPVLHVTDTTFPDAGLVGIWTKAESVSRFDDLRITPLGAVADPGVKP